jgi:hypothetical protein
VLGYIERSHLETINLAQERENILPPVLMSRISLVRSATGNELSYDTFFQTLNIEETTDKLARHSGEQR